MIIPRVLLIFQLWELFICAVFLSNPANSLLEDHA